MKIKTLILLFAAVPLMACQSYRKGGCGGGSCGKGGMGMGMGPGMGWNRDAMWKKMDANNDGQVTKDEFEKAHMMHFEELDANKDGKVTKDEQMAFHNKRMEECKGKKGCPFESK